MDAPLLEKDGGPVTPPAPSSSAAARARARQALLTPSSKSPLPPPPPIIHSLEKATKASSRAMHSWSEMEVRLRLLGDKAVSPCVENLGLMNGSQLAYLSREDCVKRCGPSRGNALFSAIQRWLDEPDENADSLEFAERGRVSSSSSINGGGGDEDAEKTDDVATAGDPPGTFPGLFIAPGPWMILSIIVTIVLCVLCCTVFRERMAAALHWPKDQKEFIIEFIKYLSIPLVSVLFTYFHIWLALWMTFYPCEYIGFGWRIPGTNVGFPLGWQGIVPFKGVKMAKQAVEIMTTHLIDVDEVFSRLDPKALARVLTPTMELQMNHVVHMIGTSYAPKLWKMLPAAAKQKVVDNAKKNAPEVISGMVNDMRKDIDAVFDLEALVVGIMTRDKDLVNHMFIKCGYKELKFIRDAGAWMGLFFGVVQMIIFYFYDAHWVLPTFGLVVGAATNWISLFATFNPINPIPVNLGCTRITLHGLFLKRQVEVAHSYARMVSAQVLTSRNILEALLRGPCSDKLIDIVHKNVLEAVDRASAAALPFIRASGATNTYKKVKMQISELITSDLYSTMIDGEAYMEEALDLENTLRSKLLALPSADFERLLHPIFEEDEWKLVLLGGVLGVVIGVIQTYALF